MPKAFVVKQRGPTWTRPQVIAFVAERVSPHKKVRKVEFIDLVPKSAAGKILRKDLRASGGRPELTAGVHGARVPGGMPG